MAEEKKRREETPEPQEPETPPEEKRPPSPGYEPYKKSARIKAWIGIIFMVILVLMYTYSVATGAIFAF